MIWFSTLILLAASAGHPVRIGPKPRPGMLTPRLTGPVTNFQVTPSGINFSGNDPDSPSVPGSATVTASWRGTNITPAPWNFSVQAAVSSFSGCPTVPASAVTARCTSATLTGNGTAACAGGGTLSASTPLIIASGQEGSSGNDALYTVTLNLTLNDSWKYIAQTSPQCTLSVTYTVNLN